MNPIQIIKNFIGKGLSPKGIVENLNTQNPIIGNLVTMAERGDTKGVEDFARNIFKERGRDFDKEFTDFKNNFTK